MLNDILERFSISQPVSVTQQYTGVINQTFKIMNSDGIFALQSMHPIFSDDTLDDIRVITDHLERHGHRVPKLISASNGEHFVRDHNNLRWRLYSWIDGRVYDKVLNADMAREAGKIVGAIHKTLRDFDYEPQGGIPHFHDTEYILKKLEGVMTELPDEAKTVAKHVLRETPDTIIDEKKLPSSIIHGDLKISNIIFDTNNLAIGVIDFDTVMRRCRAIDMGDALRSWCNRSVEDDPEAVFDNNLFEAAEKGYREGFDPMFDKRLLHRQAAKQIALELTARFLIDMVEDNYFNFDSNRYSSRQAHNWARAQGQYHLAKSI